MNKIPPPRSESGQLISEDPSIPLGPNIPSSRKDYLSEKRLTKFLPGRASHFKSILVRVNTP